MRFDKMHALDVEQQRPRGILLVGSDAGVSAPSDGTSRRLPRTLVTTSSVAEVVECSDDGTTRMERTPCTASFACRRASSSQFIVHPGAMDRPSRGICLAGRGFNGRRLAHGGGMVGPGMRWSARCGVWVLGLAGVAGGGPATSLPCTDLFTMPADAASEGIRCRLVIVRHIVKCAGTTMRGVWERLSLTTLDWHTQSVFPSPTHHCFYGASKRRREAISKVTRCALDRTHYSRVQATVEYHVSTDGSTSLSADLQTMRSLPREPSHHRIVLVGLVREPKSWFASVYRYQLAYRFNRVDMAKYIKTAQSPQLGHLLGGSGFLLNTTWMHRRHEKGLPEMHPFEGRYLRPEFRSLAHVLQAFDVLGVMEQFSQAVFLVCFKVGLAVCPHFARQWESEGKQIGKKPIPPGKWPFYDDTQVAELLALISKHAGPDRTLYAEAKRRMEADLAALDPGIRSACDAYTSRQRALTEAKVLNATEPCQALRQWTANEYGCRLGVTPAGKERADATGTDTNLQIWDAE